MTFLISTVTLLIVTYATVWALCRIAAKPTPEICTRRAPHECAVNGPCNGFPKRGTYANGRPTMPSTPEPEDEQARRRAPIYNWPYGGPHQTK